MNFFLINKDDSLQRLEGFSILVEPSSAVHRTGLVGGAVSTQAYEIPGEYRCPFSQIKGRSQERGFDVVNENGAVYQAIIGNASGGATAQNLFINGPLTFLHQIAPDRMQEFNKHMREATSTSLE